MDPFREDLVLDRRQLLRGSGLCLGSMALGSLLRRDGLGGAAAGRGPLAPRSPHFPARAKHVIYLHMIGAPSQIDLFDHKPKLLELDGHACPPSRVSGKSFAFIGDELILGGSMYRFDRHGESGHEISELLPHLSSVADDLTIVKSVHTDEINHAPAQVFLHTGFGRPGRPSFGSWVVYGLGSECDNLPAYVVMLSGPTAGAGTSLWSTGFLPTVYQGVRFRSTGDLVLYLSNPDGLDARSRRRVLDAIRELNEQRLAEVGDPEIATRIAQYEMAFRMQTSVPDLMDISSEDPGTLEMYGARPGEASFANNCLVARRLVERGVRMVQLFDSDWDHHNNLAKSLPLKCRDVDRATAALVRDLKQRGLLDDTLVVWGGEFGRTPLRENQYQEGLTPGRDHQKDAFTMLLAGGGTRPGITHGATDELGFDIVEDPVHVHDLNATVLHLLGLGHEELTFVHQGRKFRLTDVHGEVVGGLLA